jgi:SAM-dependent methyltransferase
VKPGSADVKSPAAYRAIWDRKAGLRAVYSDIYRRMLSVAVPGRILELGGGSGNFKTFAPDAVSTDILSAPWLDVVCDAQRLPFPDQLFSNVMMMDVLHHVENPLRALREACGVLRVGGRLILCEPAITPLSGIFYGLFHEEPVDMSADPLREGSISADRSPYDSNQAIPTLLVDRYRVALAAALPELALVQVDWFSFLAYPLSGGFQPWSLLPAKVAEPLLALEWRLRHTLGRLAAFRLLAVYERLR